MELRGHLTSLIVDCGAKNEIRSTVDPVHLANFTNNTMVLFGSWGQITIIKTQNEQIINSGSTETPLKEPIGDLAWFFYTSVQIETASSVAIVFNSSTEHPVKLCQGGRRSTGLIILFSKRTVSFPSPPNLETPIHYTSYRQFVSKYYSIRTWKDMNLF